MRETITFDEKICVPVFFLMDSKKPYGPEDAKRFARHLTNNLDYGSKVQLFAENVLANINQTLYKRIFGKKSLTGLEWQELLRKEFLYMNIGDELDTDARDEILDRKCVKSTKYGHILAALDSFRPYTINEVVHNALAKNLEAEGENSDDFARRAHSALKSLTTTHFEDIRDSSRRYAEKEMPAWYGLRWKELIREECYTDNERLVQWEILHFLEEAALGHRTLSVRSRSSLRSKSEPETASKKTNPARKPVFMGFAAIFLALAIALIVDGDRVQRAYDALLKEGPVAAMNAFVEEPESEREKFSMAWIQYKSGDRKMARIILEELLKTDRENALGPCSYLLASIYREEGRSSKAEEMISQAIDFYRIDYPDDYIKSQLLLFQITMDQYTLDDLHKLLEAEILLDEIELQSGPDFRSPILIHRGRIAFEKGDWIEGVSIAELAMEAAETQEHYALSQSLLGFFQLMIGEIREGHENLLEAKSLAEKIEARNILPYIELYRYYVQLCESQDPLSIDLFLSKSSVTRSDPKYRRFVYFFEKVSCLISQSYKERVTPETYLPPSAYATTQERIDPVDPGPPTYPTGGNGGGGGGAP
jgi:tetratricopeptide (TPR) repeat protein